jgi:ferredoxin
MPLSKIQKHAKALLDSQKVACVIGYTVGPRGTTRPVFIRTGEDVDKLAWNQHCTHNLMRYVTEQLALAKGKVAVVVKPCDSKAINVMLAENRFERDQVHVIGVGCSGVLQSAGGNGSGTAGFQERCLDCQLTEPVVYDEYFSLTEDHQSAGERSGSARDVSWLESASAEQRMDFWLRQFDRCIRCYACRQACPMCDCPTCLFERDDSLWIGSRAGTQEKRSFHLGRAYHLAGRCVGCNECERVCPMDIPISLLNQHLAAVMEAEFGHKAGFAPVLSPLTTSLSEKE